MEPNTQDDALIAVIRRPYSGKRSRMLVGLPPLHPGQEDVRRRMSIPRVVVVKPRRDGVFLDRFDENGNEAGDTWHETVDDAKAQAEREYGDNLGPWKVVPSGESDAVAFALRVATQEH